MSLFLCSSRSNAHGKVKGPWRAPCQHKKPFQGPRQRWGSWEEQRSLAFPRRGVIDLPTRQINIFFLSSLTDIWLLVTTLDYIRILIIKKQGKLFWQELPKAVEIFSKFVSQSKTTCEYQTTGEYFALWWAPTWTKWWRWTRFRMATLTGVVEQWLIHEPRENWRRHRAQTGGAFASTHSSASWNDGAVEKMKKKNINHHHNGLKW